MKTRSKIQIVAPSIIFALACLLSLPTCILAIGWMTAGVCCLGYRSLDDFPSEGIPRSWRHGMRGACVLFYHLAWWPWYMRAELHQLARDARRIFLMLCLSGSPQGNDDNAGDDERSDTR